MRYIILIMVLIFAMSCNGKIDNKVDKKDDKTDNKTDNKQVFYSLKPYQVIITADDKMDSVFGKDYRNWTPANNDIEMAEKILSFSFLDQSKPTVNRVAGKSLDDYNRQFVGAIDTNGDKIVWINCFCKNEAGSFKDWKEKIVYSSKPENCFFNLIANLTKNSYTNFKVNGYR